MTRVMKIKNRGASRKGSASTCFSTIVSVPRRVQVKLGPPLGQVTDTLSTPLIYACKRKLPNVVLRMLECPTECRLGQINNDRETSLTLACGNKMRRVALEFLKYPRKCNIKNVTNKGETALTFARKNGMHDVVTKIDECVDVMDFFDMYTNVKTFIGKYTLVSVEKDNMIPKDNKSNEDCIICFENNSSNIIFSKCKHVMHMCNTCIDNMEKKYPC